MFYAFNLIRQNKKGLSIIFFAFLISANIAWLNPAPGKESYQPYPKIPIFWQYNYDSGIEILTAAYFPKIFYKDQTRIDRPTYPVLANILGKTACVIICPFYKLSELEKAGVGYIALKLLLFSLALCLLNEILKEYLDKKQIFLANFLIFFSIISINNIALFHTIELQFITPIILLFLFKNILTNYSFLKNLFFSLVVGVLMLAKPNYAIYFSIIFFSIFHKKYIESILSFLFHLIPLFFYTIFLNSLSLKIRFIGSDSGQLVWFLNDIYNLEFINLINKFFFSVCTYMYLLFDNYSFWIIFAVLGAYFIRTKINKKFYLFLVLFIIFTWVQIFISFRHKTYMTSDLMIIIYSLASLGFFNILNFLQNDRLKKIISVSAFILIFSLNISAFINLPLVHPYNQPAKNIDKMVQKKEYLIN